MQFLPIQFARCGVRRLASGIAVLSLVIAADTRSAADGDALVFEKDVFPILESRCMDCHSAEKKKGGLDLSTPEGLLRGGASEAAIKAGDAHHSLLFEMVHSGEMPKKGELLSPEQIETVAKWIDGGARFLHPPAPDVAALNQHDVIPILLLRCTVCHGPRQQKGGIDLRTKAAMLGGGESGPAIVPFKPEESLVLSRIEQNLCPPPGQLLKYFIKRPTEQEIQTIRQWIAEGAPEMDIAPDVATEEPDPLVSDEDREHWAFQPPREVAVPENVIPGEVCNPIDAFIVRKLREEELDLSPEASRFELIRRAFFDLTGLPPSLEDLERWEGSADRKWFEKMIDALLDSPHYGERWGRYWLDVAGYANSEGGQSSDDIRTVAWKFRDYVIRSFNEDKPYDRFLMEQIAGDELADYENPASVTGEIVENLIATGFLRMGIDQTASRTMNFVPERLGVISDAINVLSSGVLGLTMECARCHSHKYDPIPQRDYFRLKAVFQGAFDEHDWLSWKTRNLEVATPEVAAHYHSVDGTIGAEYRSLESRRKKAVSTLQKKLYSERFPTLPKDIQEELLEAFDAMEGRRTARQLDLLERYEAWLRPAEGQLVDDHPELKAELGDIDARLAELRPKLPPPLTIRALWDRGEPSPTYFLVRGEHNRPGRLMGPGVPSVLTDGRTPFEVEPPWPGAEKTGRRLAFARWLTQPDHPLTARVLVNRVWKTHFGEGIVKTLDNFGAQGARPTHPELLDWLAVEFVRRGWSVKELHRLIMTSRTWRQSSEVTPEKMEADPENRWLARMSLRRLDAESLRDSLLRVSGTLDPAMFGPPDPVTVREDGLTIEESSAHGWRRSVYLRFRRTELPSLLATFDYPQMEPNCVQRTVSTVSPQALMLLNNQHVYELAGRLADRVRSLAGTDEEHQVETLYRLALSRPPAEEELRLGLAALKQLGAEWARSDQRPEAAPAKALATYCHTMLNSAEFLYVD